MNITNNTILITGGSSGIGLGIAHAFVKEGNKVLICGRSLEKLEHAKKEIPQLQIFSCDLSKTSERKRLYEWVVENHPACNVLINNSAIVHKTDFRMDDEMLNKAELEVQTNLVAPVALCKLFLPLLERNKNSSVVNITTGLIYAPKAAYPIYNATKAALHSFTLMLRMQLKSLPIKVVEVMMPVVDTPFHKGNVPRMAISVDKAVDEMLMNLAKGREEIRVGKVGILYALSRISPRLAMKVINNNE